MTEHRKYKVKGEFAGRLAWAMSFDGVLDAIATFPFFIEKALLVVFQNVKVPHTTWVRPRRLTRTFQKGFWMHFRVLLRCSSSVDSTYGRC